MRLLSLRNGLIALLLLMPGLASAQAKWQEGEHYTVIRELASQDKQVREVFSFWCPHCFTFEPVAAQLKQQLPKDVSFVKAHVNFMGGATPEAQNAATKAMIAARAMGQSAKFNEALFNAIHKERRSVSGMNDIVEIFAAAGGDATKLKKMAASFGLKGQVRKNDELVRGVNRVPAFIINNKYKAEFTRDMTPDQFVELIIWLTTLN